MEELYRKPDRKDLLWQLGVDEDITDDFIRQAEFRNWLEYMAEKKASPRNWKNGTPITERADRKN